MVHLLNTTDEQGDVVAFARTFRADDGDVQVRELVNGDRQIRKAVRVRAFPFRDNGFTIWGRAGDTPWCWFQPYNLQKALLDVQGCLTRVATEQNIGSPDTLETKRTIKTEQ